MIHGLKFCDASTARSVLEEAFRQRLLLELCGARSEVVKVAPPLTIEEEVLRQGLDSLRLSVEAVAFRSEAVSSRRS